MTVANVFHRFLVFEYAFVIHTIVRFATSQYNLKYVCETTKAALNTMSIYTIIRRTSAASILQLTIVDILALDRNRTDNFNE